MTNDEVIAATLPKAKAGTPGVAPDVGPLPDCITAVGSRVTCNPAPADTDQDWLVLVADERFGPFVANLMAHQWEVGGSMIPNEVNTLPPHERFNSFTLGIDNVIVTCNVEFHRRFLAASAVAKRLNLMDKSDRIALFQAVLYGNAGEVTLPTIFIQPPF